MNSDEAEQYLKDNPEKFAQLFAQLLERQPALLESMQVPHPYGGHAIPLSERQTLGLREKVKLLEGKLAELIQFGDYVSLYLAYLQDVDPTPVAAIFDLKARMTEALG